jgi:hypothetical protein
MWIGGSNANRPSRFVQILPGCRIPFLGIVCCSFRMAPGHQLALELWPPRGLFGDSGAGCARFAILHYRLLEILKVRITTVDQGGAESREGEIDRALVLCVRGLPLPPSLRRGRHLLDFSR